MPEGSIGAAGPHDLALRDAGDHALQVGSSGRGALRQPVHPGGLFLIEDLVACVREHWNIIPHLHQTQIDQLPQMIWIDRKQCPLGFDVSKRPNEVDGSKGVDP